MSVGTGVCVSLLAQLESDVTDRGLTVDIGQLGFKEDHFER